MGVVFHARLGRDVGRSFFGWAVLIWLPAARNALKRKKQHEHSLEQTNGQINMLEQQIYSIESANINQETLVAMKNAGAAMKQIHGKMTMEDVDVTMYVDGVSVCLDPRHLFFPGWPYLWLFRHKRT